MIKLLALITAVIAVLFAWIAFNAFVAWMAGALLTGLGAFWAIRQSESSGG